MHVRRLILPVALMLAVTAAPAHADANASVRMTSCTPWEAGAGGSVTYAARMRALPGAARMALRITLLEKADDGRYRRVVADDLDVWRRSRSGASGFVWEQQIRGLRQGAAYRARVRYRWLDANGRRIASARARSAECRQAGKLPNLRVVRIKLRRGEVEGTAVYHVTVANRGGASARPVGVLLRVDGEVVDEVEVLDALEPGQAQTVSFTGPVCRRRVRAVVDPKELIVESREEDNTRAPACL